MPCGWKVKAGWLIPLVNESVVKLCDPSLTRTSPESLSDEHCTNKVAQRVERWTCDQQVVGSTKGYGVVVASLV